MYECFMMNIYMSQTILWYHYKNYMGMFIFVDWTKEVGCKITGTMYKMYQ